MARDVRERRRTWSRATCRLAAVVAGKGCNEPGAASRSGWTATATSCSPARPSAPSPPAADSVTLLAGPAGPRPPRCCPASPRCWSGRSPVDRSGTRRRCGLTTCVALVARLAAERLDRRGDFHLVPPVPAADRAAAAAGRACPGSPRSARTTRDRCSTSGTAATTTSRGRAGAVAWPAPPASACRPATTAGWPCGSRCRRDGAHRARAVRGAAPGRIGSRARAGQPERWAEAVAGWPAGPAGRA